jgi:membrane-bound lytic murein transglycosylase MltF
VLKIRSDRVAESSAKLVATFLTGVDPTMRLLSVLLLLVWCCAACDSGGGAPESMAAEPVAAATEAADQAEEAPAPAEPAQPAAEGVMRLATAFTGDLDGMDERRRIRVLTVYGMPRYWLDEGQERGIVYELFHAFEDHVNEQLDKKHLRVNVIFVPVARDQLLPWLLEGRGDIAAAGLTITPERQSLVDFSIPASKPLSEILVTGPSAPAVASLDDLAGHEVYVRASSSYYESLEALNERFRAEGKPTVKLNPANELLEDEDILEMVGVGLLPWAVVDDYKAESWAPLFEGLTVRKDIVLREGGQVGYAFRKNSPQLAAMLNAFVKEHQQGTLMGNLLINRYIRDFDWAKNALEDDDYQRFSNLVEYFRKYGDQYSFDYLLVAAQGYQESQLDQSKRSNAGAVGIMQLLPDTAADPNVGIPDIHDPENNIHAGTKYIDFIRSRYFNEPGIDALNRGLFALAAYNAGPARVQSLRKKAAEQGYDPNKWFDNVEIIAAQEIGRETVQYVSNILKYYVSYQLSVQQAEQRAQAQQAEQDG